LLADEVGLGKTIEALMIWSALRAQDPQLRTLIAVPRTLVPQWCFEVQRRAERRAKARWYEGLPPILVADSAGAYDVLDTPEAGRPIIAEHSALERLTDLPLEFLVVDESHLLNAKQRAAVDKIGGRIKHLLLLTGTPRDARRRTGVRARATSEELTPFLWALRAVDPKIPPEADPGTVAHLLEDALELGALMRRGAQGDAAAAAEFVARATRLLQPDKDAGPESPTAPDLIALGREVARRATVFERVIRTRRRNVSGDILCERQLERTRVEPRAEELTVLRDLADTFADEAEEGVVGEERSRRRAASSWKAVATQRNLPTRTREALSALRQTDSKLEALYDLLGEIWAQDSSRKVVVRVAYAETRRVIFERTRSLLIDGGLRESSAEELQAWFYDDNIGPVALLQESQDSIIDLLRRLSGAKEKRPTEIDLRSTMLAQLRGFEIRRGGACLLVANDVAGTGLNLQLASDLILYDVPWRPQLAEQWIGRLDRLGRRRTNPVRIHVLSHPEAPDWDLVELYEALGIFGEGFQLPPEVGTEIERLIDRADSGRMRWGQAIAEARALLEQIEAGENDDVLLDACEPDRDVGAALSQQVFDHGDTPEGPACSIEVLQSLREVGFAMERSPDREAIVRLTMPRDLLALREIRQALRPQPPTPLHRPRQGRDPLAPLPHLDVDLRRLAFGATLRRRPSQFFSPQHPLVAELRQELGLEAGARFGAFALAVPPDLEALAGCWVACVLGRTFPTSAATAALWRSQAMQGLQDEELIRVCEIVESGLARAVSFVLQPRVQSRGLVATVQGGQLRLTDREVGAEQMELLLRSLPSARPAAQPPDAIDSALAELECRLHPTADASPEAVSSYFHDLQEFISCQRRDLLARREKTHREWRARAKEGSGNVGFENIAEREQAALRLAEQVFDRLARVPLDAAAIVREAARPRLVVAALVLLTGRR
jgi:hypothetical protein